MPWYIIVFSRVVAANIISPALIKINAGLPSMKRRLLWQFMFCLIFSTVYALFSGFSYTPQIWLIIVVGILNSYGAYSQWRAIDISLSKTSLFTQADDLIAILLGYFLINETKYLNSSLIIGIIMCFGAAAVFLTRESNLRLIKLIATYSVIWGVAMFGFRWFNLNGVPFPEFLISWYGGSFVGIIGIFLLGKEKEITIQLTRKEIGAISILALLIWSSMLLAYWSAKLAPVTVYQPIFLISEAIFPTLTGLLFFKETKSLNKKEVLAFFVGFIGIIFIVLSY